MKYIKLFETAKQRKYWSIDFTKPYLRVKVYKSSLSEDRKKAIIDYATYHGFETRILYVEPERNELDWNSFNQYEMNGEYQGEIEITPEDIEDYNRKQDAERYNL